MKAPAAIAWTWLALLVAGGASLAGSSVDVEVSREQIYLGESVLLTVKVPGGPAVPEPDLSGIRGAEVRLRDSQGQNFRHVVIVNGRIEQQSFSGRIFTYELKPHGTGAFRAGPIEVKVNGRPVRIGGPTVQVREIEEQDRVLVELNASREAVLVDEPFTITLAVALRRLPGRYAAAQPLDPARLPHITADYLDGDPIDGLEMPDVREALSRRLAQRARARGFRINRYSMPRDLFDFDSMFDARNAFGDKPAVFALQRREVTRDGKPYFEYSLALRYVPRKQGSYTFGPAVLRGDTVVAVDDAGRGVSKPVFAVGPACTVRVIPPPEEGRPDTYIGVIGKKVAVEATLDAQTCRVGDPLTLTLTLVGSANMENAYPPVLSRQEALLRSFRVYDDTVQMRETEEGRSYSYTVRPVRAGTYELPPLAVSYYDVEARDYRTVYSRPLPLRAIETADAGGGVIIAPATNRASLRGPSPRARATVAPLRVDPAGAEPRPLRPSWWHLVVAALGPAAYGGVALAGAARRQWARRRARDRRRGALQRARKQLRQAGEREDGSAASRAFCRIMLSYLGDRLVVRTAGMTPAEAARVLDRNGIGSEARAAFHRLLERHFNAAYESGPPAAAGSGAAAGREIEDVLAAVEREVKRK